MSQQEQPRDAIGRYDETLKDGLYDEIVEALPPADDDVVVVDVAALDAVLATDLEHYEHAKMGASIDAEFSAGWALGESLRARLDAPDGVDLPGYRDARQAVEDWEEVRSDEHASDETQHDAMLAMAMAAHGFEDSPEPVADAVEPVDVEVPADAPGTVVQFVHDTRAGRLDNTWIVARADNGGLVVLDLDSREPHARLADDLDVTNPEAVQTAVMAALSYPGSFDNPTWHPLPTIGIDPDSMYSSIQGAKYTGFRPAAQIAKDIRVDLKAAQAGGYLPEGLTYSVTTDTYSGGQAINVTARGLPLEESLTVSPQGHLYGDLLSPSPYAIEVQQRLSALTAQFNDVSSHSEIDYYRSCFHSSTGVRDEADTAGTEAYKVQEKFKAAYRKAKREGADEAALGALTQQWRSENQGLRERHDHLHAVKEAARAQIAAGAQQIDWAAARAAASVANSTSTAA